MLRTHLLSLSVIALTTSIALAAEPAAQITVNGSWTVQVTVAGDGNVPGVSGVIAVDPPELFTVTAERHRRQSRRFLRLWPSCARAIRCEFWLGEIA